MQPDTLAPDPGAEDGTMAFHAKFSIGYGGSLVAWLGPDEVAWTCGNAVVLQSLSLRTQVCEDRASMRKSSLIETLPFVTRRSVCLRASDLVSAAFPLISDTA